MGYTNSSIFNYIINTFKCWVFFTINIFHIGI